MQSITWTGKQFIAAGEGGIMTSRDGVSWMDRFSDNGKYLNAITWTGKQLVTVGDYGAILVSEDGVSWVDRKLQMCMASTR